MLFKFRPYSEKEKKLIQAVKTITGNKPGNLELYDLAMKHTSVAEEMNNGFKNSNERLEYLGDAILGAVIAEYLFKKYPYKDEGFLTEIRARIVNRESLNNLARKLGLAQLIEYDSKRKTSLSHKSIYGDAMEAFIGAYYLDKGFKACRRFILKRLVKRYFDMSELVETTINFKSHIIEWSQKASKAITFEIVGQSGAKHKRQFTAQVCLEDEVIAQGFGYSKKKAEQDAARKACEALELLA